MSSISLTTSTPSTVAADALVVGVAKSAKGPVLLDGAAGIREVDAAFGGRLEQTLAALGASGAAGEVTKVPGTGLGAAVLVAVGVGEQRADGAYSAEQLRRAAGAAVRALAGTESVAIALGGSAATVAEGALLGAYSFDAHRSATRAERKAPVASISVVAGDEGDESEAVRRAGVLAEAVHLTRDLVNTPPSALHPKELAEAAERAAAELGLDVEVLDESALTAGGYGGILGVGQGSANPPRLVRIAYRPAGATRHLSLVGKGVTFDSGGLSLKPAGSMETMKMDMAGAASVIAAITAIARLGVPVNVTAYAPMVENMPSGDAIRPSDVLTMYGGKTVEVLNTDAEGRLILADALVRAGEDEPDLLVDVATLTGAQLVALGAHTAGIMANDDAVRTRVHELSEDAGEAMWPMPLPVELRKSIDSAVADLANMGDRYGGMLVAATFLKEFVADGLRWVHLDIAGPAYNEREPYGYTPKGGTGASVRTLVRIAEDLAAGGF